VYGVGVEHPYTLVSGKVIWALQVDWDRDGLFGGEIEPQSISKVYIKRGRGRRLRADGGGQMQPGNEDFVIELIDLAGRYDSFNQGSPIYNSIGAPGLLLRVVAVSTTTRATAEPIFTGTLTRVEYEHKTGKAILRGEGLARVLQVGDAASLYAPCQSFSLEAWDTYFVWNGSTPYPFNYWKGRPGGLTLREVCGLILARAGWSLGAYHGSQVYNAEQPDFFFLDGSSAWDTLKSVADGFAARLFFLRDGRLYIMDRLDSKGTGADLGAPVRAQETAGLQRESPFETLRNRAEVKIRPVSVPPFNNPIPAGDYSAAWTNAGPVEVKPNSYVDISIRYNTVRTAGVPQQGNFVRVNQDTVTEAYRLAVWSRPDKTGVNMGTSGTSEGEFSLLLQAVGANQYGATYVQDGNNQSYCTVRLRNWSATLTAYFFNLQVQVIGLRETGEPGTRILEDTGSMAANGKRVLELSSRWIQSAVMAGDVGQSYLAGLSTRERASVASITYQWSGETLYTNLLAYDVGRYIDYGISGGADSQANFGISGRWLIVGQEVTWMSADGQDAFVKLSLEKAAPLTVLAGNATFTSGVGVGSLSWGHTVANGANRALVVGIRKRNYAGTGVSTVTFGAQGLTKLGGTAAGVDNNPAVEVWYLIAPAVGAGTITVTLAGGTDNMEAGAVDLVNVNQAAPVGVFAGANSITGPALVNVLAGAGDMILDVVGYGGSDAGGGDGQMVQWRAAADASWKGAGSLRPAGAASVEMRWTVGAATWALGACVVKVINQ
jgi:hypothetical protein